MGLPGQWLRPARGSAQSPPWRPRQQPRDPELRASGGGGARGLQLCRRGPERGLGAAGPRRGNFGGLGGEGSACVSTCVCSPVARPSAARTPGQQLRVQRQPAVFVQLRSSRAAPAHPGAARAGKPSQPAGPAAAAAAAAAVAQEYGGSSSA